jgi:hypothetical protein
LTVLLLAVAPVQAQGAIALETVTVRLWSEYDQPSMLVIYDFTVTADTTLPANVGIRIPKDGNITAVAYQDGNQLLNAEFAGPEEEGNWQVINFFVKEYTTYHLEYYQPLVRGGTNRTFNYQWTGEYAVNNFRLEIQLPKDSTAVKSNPMLPFAPGDSTINGSASANSLQAGETYPLELRYTRASDEIAGAPSSPQVTAEPITPNTSGRVTLDNLPYILAGVGLLLIVGASYYFWQARSVPVTKSRRRSSVQKRDEVTSIYCHECGARAHAEDRFCRVCGNKLRTG